MPTFSLEFRLEMAELRLRRAGYKVESSLVPNTRIVNGKIVSEEELLEMAGKVNA